MKKRFFLIGLIFALATVVSHAQIYQVYNQDFEVGSPVNYTVSDPTMVTFSTSIVSGGQRSIKLTQSSNDTVYITLDTVDFSTINNLEYYTLEFMHIAYVWPTSVPSQNRSQVCMIEAKRPNQTVWTQLNETHYDLSDQGTPEFGGLAAFHYRSYQDWETNPLSNDRWKKERFNLEPFFNGVNDVDKKLQVRFVVWQRNTVYPHDGWYIDDIQFRCSRQPIVTPNISMISFPDNIAYPSSRGAKLKLKASTSVPQGINRDSVYVEYTVGNRDTLYRTYLTPLGHDNLYEGRIPFYGFDTLMTYHVVAKDSTLNTNTVYFPKNSQQMMKYRCVRGRTFSSAPVGNTTNNIYFPFPSFAKSKSEFIYDSLSMAERGYGPGYIKQMRFVIANNTSNITRQRVQIKMANKSYATNIVEPGSGTDTSRAYTTTAMQIVYDSTLVMEQCAPNSYKMITLQDTFFYSGSDLVVQILYYNPHDLSIPTSIRHVPASTGKMSIWTNGFAEQQVNNPFDPSDNNYETGDVSNTRPWVQFYETKHLPLIYDCGISALAYPSYDVPCNMGTDSVVVWLKNYGVSVMNGVRIWYKVDNMPPSYFDWTGSLSAGDSVRVKLSSNQAFTVGYHTMRAWVDDSITVSNVLYRDHEPYNDTSFAPFAACDGPYSGVRTVGNGANDHFTSLDNCLYVLSRCGINGPLTIKLPAGNYGVTKFPYIPGASATQRVTFEPATASAVVTFRRPHGGPDAITWVPSLVDLEDANSIHFRNIRFVQGRSSDNCCTVLAKLGEGSTHCLFENCQFVDSNTVNASGEALIYADGSDSVTITNCQFYGGQVGVNMRGNAPDDRASHNLIHFNEFRNQVNTAISVVNQDGVEVDSNMVFDVRTNASYTVLGQHIYDGSRITRNKVYSTKGSSCIGVSDMHGTANNYSIVANNMMVSTFDNTTNMLTTPLNIIKGSYLKVVFNSVRMSAPDFVNVAAATLGGDIISNIYFQNNVITSFDTTNYAFNYMPGSNGSTMHVDHNCYYSRSGVLNKLSGTNYFNLNGWRAAVPIDQGSVVGDPIFTNGSLVDLRSFSDLLRNVGVVVPEVTIDMFGSTRDATAPSMGAYEVSVLAVDFTPVEFVTPMTDYCGAPAAIPVEVAIRNTGNGTYTYSASTPITVYYSIDNGPVQNFTVTRSCGPMDTIHFLSTRTMALPSGPNNTDLTYNIRWWVKCSLDPDDMNDTGYYMVNSRYAAPAPTVINQTIPYSTQATITPTAGINSWPISYYTSGNGRQQRSGISWYHSMEDSARFHYGPSFTTGILYHDTTFYISQKRDLPLVKITEVQVSRAANAVGVTNPMPSYMNAQTQFAVELTNCGDYPANIEGDSIVVIMTNSAAKIWVLPNVEIQPGATLVLQFKNNNNPSDSSRTIFAPSTAVPSVAYNGNFAVIYRDGHGIADAVPFNQIITATSQQVITWGNQQVPAAVWQGSAINLAQGASQATPPVNTPTAGARRIAWPTNAHTASPTATATLWQVATDANPMHLGEVENNLILYFDNGCEGQRSEVSIHVSNTPPVDLMVDNLELAEGCALTTSEPVTVTIHNYGQQAASSFVVNYSLDGGTTVFSDTIANGLVAGGNMSHTFSHTVNMHLPTDSTFHVMSWLTAYATDTYQENDTVRGDFTTYYTPDMPYVTTPSTVSYDNIDTLVAIPAGNRTAMIWYNARHRIVDTNSGTYITPRIYHPDTFFVAPVALVDQPNTHVGNLTNVMSNNFPSPYNPKQRYVKEQYLFTAEQIQAAGHGAGDISSLSFYLEALGNNVSTFTYSYYNIKIGTTTLSVFPNGNFVTGLTPVYSATDLTLNASNLGWVHHTLDSVYHWDGTSNLVIEITRALNQPGISAGANTRYTPQPNTVISKQNNTTDQSEQTSGSKGNNRPDITFGFLEPDGCLGPEALIQIAVTNVPDTDAAIVWPASLDTMMLSSCDSVGLTVAIDNHGNSNINNYTLRYRIDNGTWGETTGNANNLPLGYQREVSLLRAHFTPGRHTITAVIHIQGDTITSNDTIVRTVNVRFCGGNYIVGNCSGSDYLTLTAAVDTLNHAGIDGPVVFELCNQTFEEQIDIGPIVGVSETNTITFRTIANSPAQAMVYHTPTNSSNYVLQVHNASYVTFKDIYFYANYNTGSNNNIFANVIKVDGSYNIHFTGCTIRSKKTIASSTNANLVLLGDENYYITIDSCTLDSGYYAIRSLDNNHSEWFNINENVITNFWFQAIYLRNTDTVTIYHDSIRSAASLASKPLSGIYVANGKRVSIQRNSIYLLDDRNGGKRGIAVNNCRGSNIDRVTIYNNMISLSGTGAATITSSGISVDSLSKYVNVYFNTASLYAGPNQANTKVFSCQNSSNVHVLNNIFNNRSKGYAYYVAIDTCVINSNFNVYYTNAEPNPNTGVRFFAYWGGNICANIDSLRLVNQRETNSKEEFPYFYSDNCLALTLSQFAGDAQYNPDVTTDVFGMIRPQIPAPTIGAYEFHRLSHNISVADIIEPIMPEITTGANPTVYNIETDSIPVRVKFWNNGEAPETNISWYAYLADVYPQPRSETRNIFRLPLRTLLEDSTKVPSPLGIIDTQKIVVVIQMGSGVTDAFPEDNVDTALVFIYPAYDLQLVSVALDSTVDPLHCRMYQVPLKYTIRNVGKKDFPGDFTFSLGYDYYAQQSGSQPLPSFPNIPGASNADVRTFGSDLPVGNTRDIVNSPAYQPNLFPTGYIGDLTIKLRGFVHHENDLKPLTDTTNYINITSNHTPEMPIPHDTMVDYGTYANFWATQNASRPIRWHRDTVSGEFFYNGTGNYNRSTHWNTTPQYFHDSLYYLSCLSTRNCTSYYSQINVGINPPLNYDVSISEVRSPRGSGRVYLEKDTVTLRVVNYGSQPISNIPIAFKFMNANGRVTYLEVHDTVRATIPGRVGDNVSYFDFSFDTALLQINQPLSNTTFTLNAWVYHPDDQQRGNDTLRYVHTFRSLAESIYDSIHNYYPTAVEGFDITRVSYNELDVNMPDMIGYDNLWLGNYNASNAEIPTLFVRRGTTDTLTIEVANNLDEMDSSTSASLCVAIDYNRDGFYNFDSIENLTTTPFSKGAKVRSRREFKLPLVIPESAHYGYMRMLVWVHGDSTAYISGLHNASSHGNGQMQQYLLFVQEDVELDSVDAALTRVVTPRNHIVTESDHYVSVMLANKGRTPITSAYITYTFSDQIHPDQSGTFGWTGNLEPGMSQVIRLDSVYFHEGTTDLTCTVTVDGDTFHTDNNSLQYRYHRYYVVRCHWVDSFDQEINKWYAPAGYNDYTRNYFERGIPSKSNIISAYSLPNAYVTSCTETVVTGKRGNRSVIYSPIIDLRLIRADTIEFRLSKNMAQGSHMVLQYWSWENKWVTLDAQGVRWSAPREENPSWYDEEEGWTGDSRGEYVYYNLPTKPIGTEFNQDFQLRFVYTTPTTTSPSSSFGDGVAIDNFKLGRAKRDIDVGVTAITHPVSPQFGQTIYPRVIIHNYGLDSIQNFKVSYIPYGSFLSREATCTQGITPGGDIEFEFPDPFTITNNYPDTFDLVAFTDVQLDVYKDNDTTIRTFALSPLANDLYLYQLLSPLSNAVAGDSIDITVRLRNFGQNEIESCDVFYVFNDNDTVQEHINFSDYLGHNLPSTEFFNYTFRHRERATMGNMLLKVWCKFPLDVYPYNDSVSLQFVGMANIIDVRATAGIIDERRSNYAKKVFMAIVLDNVGARTVNDFEVGCYWDRDTSKRTTAIFHRDGGLEAGGHAVFYIAEDSARSAPRTYLTVWASCPGDTNHFNDTSDVVLPLSFDLELLKLQVEENRTDSCRVRAVIINNGTYPYMNTLTFRGRINETSFNYSIPLQDTLYVQPGQKRHIMILDRRGNEFKIPKSPFRDYVGMGIIQPPNADDNPANDQTTIIEVLNYFEGVPVAEDMGFVLEQNYPNPFDGSTRIEFALPSSGRARFFITDLLGRLVYERYSLFNQGRNTITIDKGQFPSGVYFYGIDYNGERRMRKMTVK